MKWLVHTVLCLLAGALICDAQEVVPIDGVLVMAQPDSILLAQTHEEADTEALELEEPDPRTPPIEVKPMGGGASLGFNLMQKPTGYSWGEWTTSIIGSLLMADQVFNGGDFTQDMIDEVRGKSDEPGPSVDRFGDRDFAVSTPELCEAAAQHSKDIHLHRHGESGSCVIDISSPEE